MRWCPGTDNALVYLRIVDAADGRKRSQCSLPARPVFDGMSAAGGKFT
jgi:hypothetical protein